jgi:hypothetical protein
MEWYQSITSEDLVGEGVTLHWDDYFPVHLTLEDLETYDDCNCWRQMTNLSEFDYDVSCERNAIEEMGIASYVMTLVFEVGCSDVEIDGKHCTAHTNMVIPLRFDKRSDGRWAVSRYHGYMARYIRHGERAVYYVEYGIVERNNIQEYQRALEEIKHVIHWQTGSKLKSPKQMRREHKRATEILDAYIPTDVVTTITEMLIW